MNSVTRAIEKAKPTAAVGVAKVDLHGLMTQDWPSARYVLEPIVPRRETTLLGGHGGIGKSMLALTLAAHVACGRKWGPFPAVQCRAAYVSLEDEAATVRYRLRRIVEAYNLPPEYVIDALTVFDGSGCDAAMATETMQEGVRRLEPTLGMDRVAAAVKGAGLIVVDNASDAYAGNENERRQVRSFIRLLTGIARENDAGLLLLAHIDKNAAKYGDGGNAYSGSTAWHNSVRSRLALLKDDSGAVVLEHQKSQFSKEGEPVVMAFTDHGVLMPQDARATQAAADTQATADADNVLSAIRAAIGSGRTVSTAQSGAATTWHAIEPFPELSAELKTKAGKVRVRAALVRLERTGAIVRVEYKNADRKSKERFELAQNNSERASSGAPLQSPIPPTRTGARAEARQSTDGAPIRTGAELAQLAQSEIPSDWLANADPEIRRRVEAFRVNGSNHD